MEKCNLCKNNYADKKGSHIVPHFLLKRIQNIDGKTKRDYEIGFSISGLKTESHFGRSVQPEILEETFGELSEKDIQNNKNHLVVDYFLCTACEERFAQIEEKYSKTIKKIDENEYHSGVSSLDGSIFWSSVLWRMSKHGKSGVKFTNEQNEQLRVFIDSNLPRKDQKANNKLISSSNLANNISYKILRCHNCKENDSKWLLLHPEFYNVLCLLIDEFVVVISLNDGYEEIKVTECFGLNNLILNAQINKLGTNEIIYPFDRSIYIDVSEKIICKIKDDYLSDLFEYLDRVHIALGGIGNTMPVEIKQEIANEIVFNESKLGRKYSKEEIVKATYKILNT